MNGAELSKQYLDYHLPRVSAGFCLILIAIAVELILVAMMAYGGYSDDLAFGIAISYTAAALASIGGALPFVQSIVPNRPIKSAFICLAAPLQFKFISFQNSFGLSLDFRS